MSGTMHFPKRDFVGPLVLTLEQKRLQIAHAFTLVSVLLHELATFQVHITQTPRLLRPLARRAGRAGSSLPIRGGACSVCRHGRVSGRPTAGECWGERAFTRHIHEFQTSDRGVKLSQMLYGPSVVSANLPL